MKQHPKEFSEKQKTLNVRRKRLRDNPTPSEVVFMKRMDAEGIRYIFNKGFIQGNFYCIVDFYIPKPYKLCIEIDGGYHDSPEQKRKDWAKDNYLTVARKMRVVRIKNEDVDTFDISGLFNRNLIKGK